MIHSGRYLGSFVQADGRHSGCKPDNPWGFMHSVLTVSVRVPICAVILLLAFQAAGCGHKSAKPKPPVATRPTAAPAAKPEPQPPPVAPPPSRPSGDRPAVDRTVVPPQPIENSTLRGPLIRVSLTIPAEELRISAASEFSLVEKVPETPRRQIAGQVQVRLERPVSDAPEIWRVQVASLSNAEAAEKLARQLSAQFSLPSVVHENAATGTSQVRLGKFISHGEAQEFSGGALADAGYRDSFIVREVGESAKGEPTLALRGPEGLFRISRAGYLFLPGADGGFLRLNGKPYRGTLDLSLGSNGRLVVVNEVEVEQYLLGVVPAELSPTTYPETAALAAQAIAARTYALKNLGRFRADGYDLTDDTRTQVYGGVSAEREGSSEAVRRTSGIAIYYNGSLIDAMYTSTCGGRTEDFANVFDTAPVPYLQSVFCTVENSAAEIQGVDIEGIHNLDGVLFVDNGSPANRELELAQVLGIMSSGQFTQEYLAGIPETGEVKAWVDRSCSLASQGGAANATSTGDITTRGEFIRYAAERFFGSSEIERRVSRTDASYYASNFRDGEGIPDPIRRALAYLVQRKLWQPYPDNSVRADQPILRRDALTLLIRWITTTHPEILKTGTCADPGGEARNGGDIAVKRGARTERLRLARDLRLFMITAGKSMPVARLRVIGNEKLTFHLGAGGEIDFLEVELSPSGASSDRFSPVATWQVTIPRAVVAEKLRALAGNVGEIRDLKPARLGNSGRVVQLEVIGIRGSAVINGYKVRTALGLKDTLYTLSRIPAADGGIDSFTFDGRGYGHGIGLCQTGAVGMARAGKSAEEILKTYYQGVELRKAYDRE